MVCVPRFTQRKYKRLLKAVFPRVAERSEPNGPELEQLTLYALTYRLNLFSNFTYFLDDPVNGDQFNQRDRRNVFGLGLTRTTALSVLPRPTTVTAGLQVRDDLIGELALRPTTRRALRDTLRSDDVHEASAGLFAQASTRWSDHVRTDLGLRGDAYYFDVTSDTPRNSGRRTAALASPKFGHLGGPLHGI